MHGVWNFSAWCFSLQEPGRDVKPAMHGAGDRVRSIGLPFHRQIRYNGRGTTHYRLQHLRENDYEGRTDVLLGPLDHSSHVLRYLIVC